LLTQQAQGFRIEALAKLKDVKSLDGKWTLMHFLVEMLDKNQPQALKLEQAFSELSLVRHVDLVDMVKMVK
jgi:hypothetical protein